MRARKRTSVYWRVLLIGAYVGSACSSGSSTRSLGGEGDAGETNAGASDEGGASMSGGAGGGGEAGANSEGGVDSTHEAGATNQSGGGDSSQGGALGEAGSSAEAGAGAVVDSGDSVLMHHKNLNRDGLYVQPKLTKAAVAGLKQDTAFHPVLGDANDHIYAQPLFVDGGVNGPDLVIVATEANNVYAFDASTGAQAWKATLGAPVPLATLATCGNIDPYGVTGTPVIDFASRRLFVAAQILATGNVVTSQVFALSIDTGLIVKGWPVNVTDMVPSFQTKTQGQRGALAILNGVLYVPYGGLYGDCPTYHGRLLAISISKPSNFQSWATDAAAGGIWAPSGIASDGTSLYVTTGNTQSTSTWAGGDAMFRFTPGASFTTPSYWAPPNWHDLDNGDLDIGATGPVVFDLPGSTPSALALAFGKDGNAYLLNRNNLGGISDALGALGTGAYAHASLHVVTNEVITAAAVYTTGVATYVAFRGAGALCSGGTPGTLATLKVVPGSPPTLHGSWCAMSGSGSPMVTTSDGHSDAIVWQTGADASNHLNAFDGDTGAAIPFTGSSLSIPNMRRFNTPIAAKGRIFVAADNAVIAFKP